VLSNFFKLVYRKFKQDLILNQLESRYTRGFRWRPDNGLLVCYSADYDTPPLQIDCTDFVTGAVKAIKLYDEQISRLK
jgi:hypothetical protein